MPHPKNTTRQKKQQYFDLTSIMDGVKDPHYVLAGVGDWSAEGLKADDLLLVDHSRTKPKDGDIVAWGTGYGDLTISYYDDDYEYEKPVWGIAVSMIRRFPKKKKQTKAKIDPQIESLRQKLDKLERLPENEAVQLQLESEIYRLENQSDEEWPDEIAA